METKRKREMISQYFDVIIAGVGEEAGIFLE